MSSEKSSSNDRDEPARQVSDELLRKASEGPVRHLPDALFGGPVPAREAGSERPESDHGGAVSDELLRKASEGPVRHLPDLLFGGSVPKPAAPQGDSGAEGVDRPGGAATSGDAEGDTGPPGSSGDDDSTTGPRLVPSGEAGNSIVPDTSADLTLAANTIAGEQVSADAEDVAVAAGASGALSKTGADVPVDSPLGAVSAASSNNDAGTGDSAATPTASIGAVAVGGSVAEGTAADDSGVRGSAVRAASGGAVGAGGPATSVDDVSAVGPAAESADAGDSAPRPVLLVIADSLSYFGPKGGLPADDPRIWPNLVAAELDWDVELVARIGWTCRDAYWALIGDPRVWAAVPRAGAVVFATGGMDSLPSPLPTALRELIRYVRPPVARRVVRDGYNWLQPRLSKLGRPVALPPRVSIDYLEQSRTSLAQLRPELPVVGVLPSVHDCEAYGRVHSGREPAVAALREWSAKTDVPLVDLAEAVRDNIFSGDANPDGIHWGWEAHTAVARAMVKVISEVRSFRCA